MISIETLALFYLTSLLLALSPGPDNIFVLMQSLQYGKRKGLWIALGLCTGLLTHSALSIAGISALLFASHWAMTGLTVFGAGYLLWLAMQSWQGGAISSQSELLNDGAAYRRGIIMNISNPKVSVFFIAFLPQFTNTDNGSITYQLLILSIAFITAAWMVMSGIAIFADTVGKAFLDKNTQQKTHKITAIVFVLLAVNLVLQLFEQT